MTIGSARLFLFLWLAIACLGCKSKLPPGQPGTRQTKWMGESRHTSAKEAFLYMNEYQEYEGFGRYPGYGMAIYYRDSEQDVRVPEVEFIRDSLRLCREDFSSAYESGYVQRPVHTTKGYDYVPFQIEYVAIVVADWNRSLPQTGIIVPASSLFSNTPLDEVMASGTIARGELWFEDISEAERQQGYSPGLVQQFKHVEEHMRQLDEQLSLPQGGH
jgi:hypothetical protein